MDREKRAKSDPHSPLISPAAREEAPGADDEQSRNYQRRLNDLYRSDRYHEQVIGFWAKFAYEFAVKSVPVGLAVAAGLLGRWLGLVSYGTLELLSWGVGVAVSITFVGWCMSEGNRTEEAGASERST